MHSLWFGATVRSNYLWNSDFILAVCIPLKVLPADSPFHSNDHNGTVSSVHKKSVSCEINLKTPSDRLSNECRIQVRCNVFITKNLLSDRRNFDRNKKSGCNHHYQAILISIRQSEVSECQNSFPTTILKFFFVKLNFGIICFILKFSQFLFIIGKRSNGFVNANMHFLIRGNISIQLSRLLFFVWFSYCICTGTHSHSSSLLITLGATFCIASDASPAKVLLAICSIDELCAPEALVDVATGSDGDREVVHISCNCCSKLASNCCNASCNWIAFVLIGWLHVVIIFNEWNVPFLRVFGINPIAVVAWNHPWLQAIHLYVWSRKRFRFESNKNIVNNVIVSMPKMNSLYCYSPWSTLWQVFYVLRIFLWTFDRLVLAKRVASVVPTSDALNQRSTDCLLRPFGLRSGQYFACHRWQSVNWLLEYQAAKLHPKWHYC